MNENLTELVFIIDRSGSMAGLEGDTIGGFNATVESQRRQPGEALVTTVLFDDKYEVLHRRTPIGLVGKMTRRQYQVRGCTALLDAVGRAIEETTTAQKAMPKGSRPAKTIVVIITDGLENASRRYARAEVKSLIERRREKKGWEFLFLGANMDAVAEAGKMGICEDRSATYLRDSAGTAVAYDAVASALTSMRCSCSRIGGNWKDCVDEDKAARS